MLEHYKNKRHDVILSYIARDTFKKDKGLCRVVRRANAMAGYTENRSDLRNKQ